MLANDRDSKSMFHLDFPLTAHVAWGVVKVTGGRRHSAPLLRPEL